MDLPATKSYNLTSKTPFMIYVMAVLFLTIIGIILDRALLGGGIGILLVCFMLVKDKYANPGFFQSYVEYNRFPERIKAGSARGQKNEFNSQQ